MDPIEASMQADGSQPDGAAATAAARGGDRGGGEQSMMELLLDGAAKPAAPAQAPVAPGGGFGDLIQENRVDRGAGALAPPAGAAGGSSLAGPDELLAAQARMWAPGAAGAGGGAGGGGGQKQPRGKKGGDDDEDDDWQPGKKQSKRARTGGAAAARGGGGGGAGAGDAIPSMLGGTDPAGALGGAAGWDTQALSQWMPGGFAPMPGAMAGAFGRGGGGGLMPSMLGGGGGGAFMGGPGAYPLDAGHQAMLAQQQQFMMQQQLMNAAAMNAGGARLYPSFGGPPLTYGAAFGGAVRPGMPGFGGPGMWTRGRNAAPFMAMQQAPPPEPESAHEADELLSKCEQISASLHAALKTRPIKIKKKKHHGAPGSDGGAAPGKLEEGADGSSGGGAKPAANGAAGVAAGRGKPPLPEVKMDGGAAVVQVVSESESDPEEEGDLVSRGARLEAATGPASAYLKPYQLVGINFLLLLYRQKVGGAILADEMGLGKTAQAICFLGVLSDWENDRGPHLVCAPASLLDNWAREIGHWCPKLRVLTYHGNSREETRGRLEAWRMKVAEALDRGDLKEPPPGYIRPGQEAAAIGSGDRRGRGAADDDDEDEDEAEGADDSSDGDSVSEEEPDGVAVAAHLSKTKELLDEDEHNIASGRGAFDVMLTTYSMFERESQRHTTDRAFLRKWKWSQVVMDEAHALKNAASSRARRLRRLAQ
ncbi:SNF2 family DNA-dependent ATPase, partial [Monoraphidium neglectum]